MSTQAAQLSDPPPVPEISREEILRRLGDSTLTIVDVLPVESYQTAHIPGSISAPLAEIDTLAGKLLPDPAAEIAVYCAKFT
jgi:rhodanese-related sulfurtransferase